MPKILHVALPTPVPGLFDYLQPAGAVARPGCRVEVPFGNRRRVGLVVGSDDLTEVAADKLKPAHALLDQEPLLDEELRQSLAWAGRYWLGVPGEVYLGALPVALRRGADPGELVERGWAITARGDSAHLAATRRGHARALLAALHGRGAQSAATLDAEVPGWRSASRRLLDAGLIARADFAPDRPLAAGGHPLTAEQVAAVSAVVDAGEGFAAFLLDGVTGSGKTEVYLALMEKTLAAGRQCLMLVPEIGLAPQTVERLGRRLGTRIEVLHSNLAEGDRARAWLRARNGDARVIVGTRSAVFTPLPRAGLIVIDEEHDASYKQQDGFRYHARDLAVVRARALGVPVVLGSATPSLESRANAIEGRYRHLHLKARPVSRPPPSVEVIDLCGLRRGLGLSPKALDALDECMARGQQAMVFRNRLGFAPVLMCHHCGWHATCPGCERPLTLHQARNLLLCHHCGRREPARADCPGCGALPLKPLGFGTERLEEALVARYPDTAVLRIDSETTRRRDGFARLLAPLASGQAAILIGTQMLAKGHDLPELTLVVITGIDGGLYSVDFRAPERLAQLITQVAGRAGRADKPGRVLLQTHQPRHPLLRNLLREGYGSVAADLLAERQQAALPPYAFQVLLRADAEQQDALDRFLQGAAEALPGNPTIRRLGPLPAPMPRRAGRLRAQLMLESDHRSPLHAILPEWRDALRALPGGRRVRWSIDVDPIDLS